MSVRMRIKGFAIVIAALGANACSDDRVLTSTLTDLDPTVDVYVVPFGAEVELQMMITPSNADLLQGRCLEISDSTVASAVAVTGSVRTNMMITNSSLGGFDEAFFDPRCQDPSYYFSNVATPDRFELSIQDETGTFRTDVARDSAGAWAVTACDATPCSVTAQ